MKSKLRLLVILGMVLFLGHQAIAQISEKGTPASFAYKNMVELRSTGETFTTPIQFDVAELKEEDKIAEENNTPLRTAIIIPVELNAKKDGEWTTLPSGQQIWRLTIHAPDAIAVMLYYDEFVIPEGGKLFIYNEDQSHIIGAYTSKTNPTDGAFATEFVAGDKITLEYNAPFAGLATNSDVPLLMSRPAMPNIKISGVSYGYNYLRIGRTQNILKIGESDDCEVNINCPEGDDWQDQKKGVAKTVTPIGSSSYLCSGTLVNNTAQDMTPFFLTASHCIWDNAGTTTMTPTQMNQIMYYFHYESPTCATTFPTAQRTLAGAQLLIDLRISGSSDGVLYRLNSSIPLDWDLYFNGWDRRDIPATSGVGIHHPSGDVKKISTFTGPVTSWTWNNTVGATNAHWLFVFTPTVSGHGVTEGGSSGSPMFNQNGLVVGTLTGGNSSCDNLNGINAYGKLWYHWDHVTSSNSNITDNTKTMSDYLDPLGTGQETLNGTYSIDNLPAAEFIASSTNIYALESIEYTDYSVGATSWQWTFQGGTPATYTGQTPPPIQYLSAGSYTTTLEINGGSGPQETKTENIMVTIKGTPAIPVADFGVPDIVYSEGFDAAATWSTDWIVKDSTGHVSPRSWSRTNGSPNFNTIDPSSTASAYINWNAANANTWLKTSNDFPIVTGSFIEFYACYDGAWLNNAHMNFLVSDDGTTWTQLWTTGTAVTSRAFSWSKQVIDLSGYAGQSLYFAWQYEGADGNSMAVDGIKLFDLMTSVTLNVGDYLTPYDLSTGTPVLWDWTFNGATPVNTSGEAPSVQYMTVGTYNVSLTVTNTAGTDSKTLNNAVTVIDKTTVADFKAASPGYTMRDNFGPYITPNNSVNFIDISANYPTSWNWTFTGGLPPSSTVQNPSGIAYNTSGIFDVALVTDNTVSSPQTKTVPGFVKAMYDDPTRIWNLEYGENLSTYTVSGTGIFGSSGAFSMCSERFDAPMAGGFITAVDIKCLKTNTTATGNITVEVYTDNKGRPGTILGTAATIPFDNTWPTTLATAAYYTATFATPILVSDAFHIRISGIANSAGVVIPCAAHRGDLQKNTSLVYYDYDSEWVQTSKFMGLNTSMDVVPYFEYTTHIQAAFEAEYKGYIREANYGRFIPTGVALDFFDRTVGVPNDWSWTFTGGSPNSSTDVNPQQISYNTAGNYPVRLDVQNSSGSTDYIETFDYVMAGYDVDDRIWNMIPGELGDVLYTIGPDFVTGTNTYGDIAYAERFDAPLASGYMYGVDLMLESIGGSGTLEISICKDSLGLPGPVLTSETLNVSSIASGAYTRVMFTNDAYTDGAFFVVVSGFDALSGDVAIYSSNMLPASDKNTAYIMDASNDWWSVPEAYGINLSLNLAPLFTYHIPTFSVDPASSGFTTSDLSVTRKNIDLKEDTVSITSSVPWTVTTTASWVNISTTGSNGNDDFWFSVTDNTTPYPRVAKIIVAPTGLDKLQQVITIRQASTYPANLTAAFDSNGDVQIDWDAMPLSAPAPVKPTPVEVSLKSSNVKRQSLSDLFAKNGAEVITSQLTTQRETNISLRSQEKDFVPSNTRSSLKAAPAETVVRWGNGVNYAAWGGENSKMEVATLFTAADMNALPFNLPSGISKIKEVEVYIDDLPVNGIVLKIRQGSIVYRQEVPNSQLMSSSFNTIILNEPFVLDKVSDTYIGYEFYCNDVIYVAGVDAGPAITGKGDLYSKDDGPLSSFGYPFNWNIAAKIETGRVDNYVLYRDGVEITRTILPTATPSYLDTDNLAFGNHCYGIAALFDDLESTPSPDVCVFQLSPENSLFTVAPSSLQFAAGGDMQDITITINDPSGYISTYSLNFYNDLPAWLTGPTITPTITGYTYTYTAAANTTGSVLSDDIHIWLSASGSSTCTTSNGYVIPATQMIPLSPGMLDFDLSNRIYNGYAQPVSVALNSAYSGLGAITVLYNGSPTAPVNAGTYAISINALAGSYYGAVTGLSLGNYTIDPAPLTIRPYNVTRPYETANPATFDVEFITLLGADTPADIVGLTVSTTATTASMPGRYPITASGGVNANYTITYVDGTLTVGTIDQTIDFQPVYPLYVGDVLYAYATSSVGLPVYFSSGDPSIATVASNGKITAIAAGLVEITAYSNGNTTYSPAYATISLLVMEKPTVPVTPPDDDDPGVGSEFISSQGITVYPNPVSKSAPVYFSANVDEALLTGAVITVYSESGSLVKNVQVTGKLTKVDLSVDSGTYLFVLKGKTGIIKTMKVIVK